ncbi:tRNA-intron lyase [Candidatus Woesearchaeota archaeon CG_4_10_14_0_2_um_filter_57_5]|nr:MAG: tRNA-intron lyase [Candidatus Woesearchaeota archaeon CG1_02_57_44]PIN70886.1 MAG: tRNA-intron lyase [Candidatus Woesearchaeota archaeon CG11_big_fil_rev_8_21_14_0_20_57_5]PIZ50041.1 MAG: tRNA-intron lyase [Candidatus Woesearchaeota archaeon CG_4_10_14_0_2_um_filter_57_5]
MHQATYLGESIIAENDELHQQAGYGEPNPDGTLQLSLLEGLFLTEKGRLTVRDTRGRTLTTRGMLRMFSKTDPQFRTRYIVFSDLRSRGYIVKTALKFGADFRVYDRGVKPGDDHAKWVVYPVAEGNALTWQDFAAKNRVAHSTRKRLLMGVVDDENGVSYWEVRWMRP